MSEQEEVPLKSLEVRLKEMQDDIAELQSALKGLIGSAATGEDVDRLDNRITELEEGFDDKMADISVKSIRDLMDKVDKIEDVMFRGYEK